MKKIHLKINRNTFIKFFFSYLAIFLVLIMITFIVLITILMRERQQKSEAACQEYAKRVGVTINTQFNEIYAITNSLRNTTWVSKLMSNTDIFKSEFDILRQKEISLELSNYAAVNKIIEDVSIIYPQNDTVITSKGWWRVDEYSRRINSVLGIDESFIQETVLSDENNYGALSQQDFAYHDKNRMIMLQQLEFAENPRAIALITVNKKRMSEVLDQLFIENLASIQITDNDNNVLISQINTTIKEANFYISLPCSSLLLNVETDYYIDSNFISNKDFITIFILGLAVIIFAVFLSYILASISYSPLNKLLSKFNINKNETIKVRQSEYRLIEDSIQNLYDENSTMQEKVIIYKEEAKKSFYMQLLKGYFCSENLVETLAQYEIHYTDEKYFAVMSIYKEQLLKMNCETDVVAQGVTNDTDDEMRAKVMIAAEYAIRKMKLEGKVIDTLDSNIVIILCFEQEPPTQERLHQCMEEISDSIYELYAVLIDASVSRVHKGIIGISVAYQEAQNHGKTPLSGFNKAGIFMDVELDNMYYYPTDWEQQLISNLKAGNFTVVQEIIKEIEKENESRSLSDETLSRLIELLIETISRVSFEVNIVRDEMIKEFSCNGKIELTWKTIYDLTFYICEKISAKNVEMIQDINNEILTYINQNYSNPEISLKTISSRFNISVASVSRIFKDVTDINFHEYVTSLRMEKAKELLKSCGYDIKNISKAVGYDSEYSFKRAFLRVEGIKPRVFADQHKITLSNQ